MANRIIIQTNQAKFPTKIFFRDNENAIKIQIYCVLIVNLLIGVIKKSLKDNGLSLI
jgi:hypothetical protein